MKTRLLLLPLLLSLSAGGVACSKADAATLHNLPSLMTLEAFAATRNVSEVGLLLGLNGSPTYLGAISATTSAKNNADATAFTIEPDQKILLLHATAAVKVLGDTNATEDITVTNGLPIKADEKWVLILKSTQANVQAITDSSTSTVSFWSLD
jgi:hypothetical protein